MSWKTAPVLVAGNFLLACAPASHCPPTSLQEAWSASCFSQESGVRQVKAAYRKNIVTNQAGVAVITIGEPREMLAVDRTGRVTIPHIYHAGDFDYPTARGGVGRFAAGASDKAPAQCGYFDTRSFRVLIPAAYDHCRAFDGKEALACKQCKSYCTQPECQDRVFIGGQGFALGRDNQLLRSFTPASLDTVCGATGQARVTQLGAGIEYLECVALDATPFRMKP